MSKKGILASRLEKMQHTAREIQENRITAPSEEPEQPFSLHLKGTPLEEHMGKRKETFGEQQPPTNSSTHQTFLYQDLTNFKSEDEKPLPETAKDSHWKLSTRIVNIFLIVCCIYVLFLIYGVVVTDYQYNGQGKIEPQVLSVKELKQKDQYETIYYQYLHCRNLYEKVLLLDYRIGKGEEDPLTIAPEYEALLDEVSDLSIKTDALEVDTKYSQVKNLLLKWIKDDIAVYLQNMSAAISQNNAETANNALQDKDRVYSDFSIITQNMVAMGEKISGVDLMELKEWTPESYVDKKINGE